MYRCYAYTETHICMHFMYFAFSHESVPHRILSCHLHIFSLYSIFNVHPLLQKTDALPLASSLLVGRGGGLHYGRREEVTSDRGSHVVLHAALTERWQKDSKWLISEEPQGVFNLDTQSVSRVFFRQQLSKWWGVWSPWPYHGPESLDPHSQGLWFLRTSHFFGVKTWFSTTICQNKSK